MLISKPSKRPGPHDVVKIAGCSYQTVSRIVNGDAQVNERTRERVLAAIETVEYRHNTATRALMTSRPGTIGVISDGSWRYGPTGALRGVREAIHDTGYLVLLTVQERDAFRSLGATLRRFADAFVNGIVAIVPFQTGTKTARKVAASFSWANGLPMVMLTPDPRPTPGIRVVTENQKFGARLVIHYLVRLGHQHIVHLMNNQKQSDGSVRLKGWQEELLSSGLPAPGPILGSWAGQSGYHAGARMIKKGLPDAVFAAFDLMALGMMRTFSEAGARVPKGVSVVGFDDHESARQFFPSLAMMRQDLKALDLRCLKILLSSSDGDHLSEPIRLRLLVRLSTCRKARSQPRTGYTEQHVGSATGGFPVRSRLARARCIGSLVSTPIVHPATPQFRVWAVGGGCWVLGPGPCDTRLGSCLAALGFQDVLTRGSS